MNPLQRNKAINIGLDRKRTIVIRPTDEYFCSRHQQKIIRPDIHCFVPSLKRLAYAIGTTLDSLVPDLHHSERCSSVDAIIPML